jgi:gas vesicle protein
MIVIFGLVILVAAVIVGVGGVLGNGGNGHALTHGFSLFGYHVTGSTGTLFLYGIVVGAVALFGLSLLLAGARRTSLRGRAARRGLKQSRHETATVSRDRDDMIDQRDTARAETASARQDDAARGDTQADSEADSVAGQPTAAVPAGEPVAAKSGN